MIEYLVLSQTLLSGPNDMEVMLVLADHVRAVTIATNMGHT